MIFGIVGASMVVSSVVGIALNSELSHLKRTTRKVFDAEKLVGIEIRKATKTSYGYAMEVMMPYGLTMEEFKEKCLNELAQATYSHIKVKRLSGPVCSIQFGRMTMEGIVRYDPKVSTKPMEIPLATPFGPKFLNLKEDSSCHIMGGGATRMGKTSLINLIITHSMRSTRGKIQVLAAASKIADFHIYKRIPQIMLAEEAEEVRDSLEDIVEEMNRRKQILKEKGDVKDIQSLRLKYPDTDLPPILVVIDEFGNYSDKNDPICKKIRDYTTELAERAGYLDIHLVLFSQRVDVSEVYPPRVKNNILTKIAFTVGAEADSKLIIGVPDAFHLGAIKGRAIIVDGLPEVVQVPYISEEDATRLLQTYYSDERVVEDDTERQEIDSDVDTLPGFVAGPVGSDDLPGSSKATYHDKPDRKKVSKRRIHPTDHSA